MLRKQVYWQAVQKQDETVALTSNIKTQVVVVGGGMAGLMCAQQLALGGKQVVLLEKDYCGANASGKSSGFITPDSEIELSSLIAHYGEEKARHIWGFVLSGVEAIRQTIQKLNITCDYQVQDSLFIATSRSGIKHVRTEHQAREALHYVSTLYDRSQLNSVIGSDKYFSAVCYPDTFGINSYLFCQALKKYLEKNGVQIFEHSLVSEIRKNIVQVGNLQVRADYIVVCADHFIPDLGKLQKEIYHIQTFLAISKPLSQDVVRRIFPEKQMMVWDNQLVYNYFRITGKNRLLLGGGDVLYTYARNQTKKVDRFAAHLAGYFRRKFPDIAVEFEYIWPGMLGISKDLLPVVGQDEILPRVWYIGAATGLPWAAALGQYLADKILSGRDDWDVQFSARRKFVIGPRLQTLLGTPSTYAISHGIAKYL